jgi:hypothetical protein
MVRYPEQLISLIFFPEIYIIICYFHTKLKYGFCVRNFNMPAMSPTLRSVAMLAAADSQHSSSLTLSLLMSYIYGAPCKARNFNVVRIWTYVWQR